MDILTETSNSPVPITIVSPVGELDGSNYQTLIAAAQGLYTSGTRRILLDMGKTSYISSAGLVALHSIVALLRGDTPPDPEYGWEALHSLHRDAGDSMQQNVKLLDLQPQVQRTLEKTGLIAAFEVFSNRDEALASFLPAS